jgi:tetratricopeptide (TPR) repeat protein
VQEFERAIAIDPKNDDAYRGLADVYAAQNLPEKAEQTHRRAIGLQPGYWAGHYGLANFLILQQRFDEAIAAYDTVLRLTPDNVYAHNNLGAAYFLSGRFDEAIRSYRRSIEITPNSDSFSNLGTALYYKGSFDEAAQMFRRATEIAPDDYRLWANLAEATAHGGEAGPEALAHYEHAMKLARDRLAINPSDAEAYGYVARCAAALGDTHLARQAINRAMELAKDRGGVLLTAALVFNKLGEADSALRYLEQAIGQGYPVKLLAAEPELENLSTSPRFIRLLDAGKGGDPAR